MLSNREKVEVAITRIKQRRKGTGAGSITDSDIARVLNIHPTTLHRWLRGESFPQEEETIRRLTSLSQQVSIWYRRICPFILAVWTPVTGNDSDESESEDAMHHSEYFDQVVFEPINASQILQVKIRTAISFRSLHFMVIGTDRGNVSLATKLEGPFHEKVEFWAKARNQPIGIGEYLSFYVKYDV